MYTYFNSPLEVKKVLNDTVFIKVAKTTDEYKTKSGIFLAAVEHDFLSGEVIKVNDFYYNSENKKEYIDLKPGDTVLFEKNFHHRYGEDYRNKDGSLRRDRVDHLVEIAEDSDFKYYVIPYQDIYLKEVPEGTEGAMQQNLRDIKGTLYSLITPKKVTKVAI